MRIPPADMGERPFENGDDRIEPLDGAIIGGASADARLRPDRRHDRDLVAHGVETTIIVGRIMTASGTPIGSALAGASRSISRTMS